MSQIYNILKELEAVNGKNAKLEILKKNKDNTLLQAVLKATLDTTTTQYYIKKIPQYFPNTGKGPDLSWALEQLGRLSRRAVTGNNAVKHLQMILDSVESMDAKVIERVIERDLKCGVDTSVDKIWPGLIPEYPMMLSSPSSEKVLAAMRWPAIGQLKSDGMRFNAQVRDGVVSYFSRQGRPLDLLGELDVEFQSAARAYGEDVVFDGELLLLDNEGSISSRTTGNGVISKAVKGKISKAEASRVIAKLWDVIPCKVWDKCCKLSDKYGYRLDELTRVIKIAQKFAKSERIQLTDTRVVNNIDEANAMFEEYLAKGEEGIILKDARAQWENKRAKHQVKFKAEEEADLIVVGWEEGKKGSKNEGKLGALIAESSDGKIRVNVGGGWSDELREEIKDGDWAGEIIAVRYNCRVKDKRGGVESLFLPRFICKREDKTVANSNEEIK